VNGLYRILWKNPDRPFENGSLSELAYPTVTAASLAAEQTLKPYDIAWASGRRLPDWYRQMCLRVKQ
jgi:hypothetical protein